MKPIFFALFAALAVCSLAAFDPSCGTAPPGAIIPNEAEIIGSPIPTEGKVIYDCDNKGAVIKDSWTATFEGNFGAMPNWWL